ncbi:hypothetical protein FSP39_006597 [Pinctada imbricata]|uniref:Solute carrier family 12 member 9 n=1 Tax=Pinctada imbricata TaxID=66713 RepID=A0AA88YN20_PINIB|nr:hypothetical protein FSP39_006597 [Pinctada imbricata]
MEDTPLLGRARANIWALSRSLSRYERVDDEGNNEPVVHRTLGMFAGVFCPVALSMFSTLLFLRSGFQVGQAGILESVAMLVLAYFILVMTVLSICAISTNGALEGGGAYSNVLATGLYVSGFVEAVLDNFGYGGTMLKEGDFHLRGVNEEWWKYLYSSIVLAFCMLVVIVGSSMFAKTSLFIFMVVIVCTLSVFISIFAKNEEFNLKPPDTNKYIHRNKSTCHEHNLTYTGLSAATFKENIYSEYEVDYITKEDASFATVFAIVFSSVTGILNGANMSGELKEPSKAIPRGTLGAVCFTFIVYLIEVILISGSNNRCLLLNNYIFLQEINLWGPFVLIGIFAATLSAALGNLIGASRILQALANDHLFGVFLKPATKTACGGNPYVAVLISWILVQLVLLVGSLNAIAPINSVFFLLSYASVNLACLGLELASAPNFRPTFKYFTWYTCGCGLVGSMIMCFLISPLYSSIAIVIMLLLAIGLHFRSLPSQWGSISQALIFHQVRKYLLMLDLRKAHIKFWRPQILLLVAQPRQCWELIDFINDIKKGGLFVIGHVKVDSLDNHISDPILEEYPRWLSLIDNLKVKAFIELTMANSISEGLQHLLRISGLGGMKPNTVCLGFYDDAAPEDSFLKIVRKRRRLLLLPENGNAFQLDDKFQDIRKVDEPKNLDQEEYVKLIRDSLKMSKNVCLCRGFHHLSKQNITNSHNGNFYIDVWPVNLFRPDTASYFDNTCLFMLQLACILDMVPAWRKHTKLRVFLCLNAQTDDTLQKEQKLDAFLHKLRILAKIKIVTWDHLDHHLPKNHWKAKRRHKWLHSIPCLRTL